MEAIFYCQSYLFMSLMCPLPVTWMWDYVWVTFEGTWHCVFMCINRGTMLDKMGGWFDIARGHRQSTVKPEGSAGWAVTPLQLRRVWDCSQTWQPSKPLSVTQHSASPPRGTSPKSIQMKVKLISCAFKLSLTFVTPFSSGICQPSATWAEL